MPVRVPHLSAPFRVVGGSAVVVEQGSDAEIRDCVVALLSTRLGSRLEELDYGIPDELFELMAPGMDAETVLAVIEEWEPRATVSGSVALDELIKTVQLRLDRSE